jgi:hypothetical protein
MRVDIYRGKRKHLDQGSDEETSSHQEESGPGDGGSLMEGASGTLAHRNPYTQ